MLDSFQLEMGDFPLRPFPDCERRSDMAGVTLIVVRDRGGYHHVSKPTRFIQVGNRLCIPFEEGLAEAAPAEPERARLQEHALAKRVFVEILIALKLDV